MATKPNPAAGKTFKWKGSTTPHTVPYKQWATHHPQKAAARTKALKAAGKLGGGGGASKTGGGGKRGGTPWQQKPVVAGSSMTRGELNQAARADVSAAYGPQQRAAQQKLGGEQQFGRDIPDFYRQYQQSLQQHATNIANYQAGAQAALGQIGQGITGLAGQDVSQLQQNANRDAAARGTTAGNYVPTANAAAATRQALLGSFQAQQALNAPAQTGAADTLANVIAPQQRLQAVTQQQGQIRKQRQAISDLATQAGAESLKYRAGVRETERKNVLAGQIAGVEAATKIATVKAQNKFDLKKLKITGNQQKDLANIRAGTTRAIARGKGDLVIGGTGPFAAYTPNQLKKLPRAQRQQILDAYTNKIHPPKTGKKGTQASGPQLTPRQAGIFSKYGVKAATQPKIENARGQISTAKTWLDTLKKSKDNKLNTAQIGQLLIRGQPGATKGGKRQPSIPAMNGTWVLVAQDLDRYGGLNPGTADRLWRQGYAPQWLGLKVFKNEQQRKANVLSTAFKNVFGNK